MLCLVTCVSEADNHISQNIGKGGDLMANCVAKKPSTGRVVVLFYIVAENTTMCGALQTACSHARRKALRVVDA